MNNNMAERETEKKCPENAGTEPKPKRKWTDNFIFYMIATFLMVLGGQLLGTIIFYLPIVIVYGINATISDNTIHISFKEEIADAPLLETLSEYLIFIGIWIVCLLWFLRKNNRPLYKTLGTTEKGNTVPMFLLGLLIGTGMNGLCIFDAYLHGDISLFFDSFKPLPLLLIFISVLIQSSAEELLFRCYLYRKLLNRYNPIVAILVSSAFFAVLHLGNPGIGVAALIEGFASGLSFALMVYYFDSIWCAFAAHTAWNFTQNIIFGLPNSGLVVPFSILKLDASTASDSFFYNVGFGVEGTIFAILVDVAACALILLWGRRRVKSKNS